MKHYLKILVALLLASCGKAAPVAMTMAATGGTIFYCYGCSTKPPVNPTPVPTGGSAATGGRSSTGGALATGGQVSTGGATSTGGSTSAGNLAHCIAALTKDPGVANVAVQQGMTAKALATKECADPNILRRYP